MVIHINVLLQRRHGDFVYVVIMVMLGVNILIVNTLREDTSSALGGFFSFFCVFFLGLYLSRVCQYLHSEEQHQNAMYSHL